MRPGNWCRGLMSGYVPCKLHRATGRHLVLYADALHYFVIHTYEEPGQNDFEVNEDDYLAALAMGSMGVNVDGKVALDDITGKGQTLPAASVGGGRKR